MYAVKPCVKCQRQAESVRLPACGVSGRWGKIPKLPGPDAERFQWQLLHAGEVLYASAVMALQPGDTIEEDTGTFCARKVMRR